MAQLDLLRRRTHDLSIIAVHWRRSAEFFYSKKCVLTHCHNFVPASSHALGPRKAARILLETNAEKHVLAHFASIWLSKGLCLKRISSEAMILAVMNAILALA